MIIPTMAIKHVFVYGSLRPDDDSGQAWTREAVRGLVAQRARLPDARLFRDTYACAVLGGGGGGGAIDDDEGRGRSSSSGVLGYVLTTEDEVLFADKLAAFDRIEGYRGPNSASNLYDRTAVEVELLGEERRAVMAYVYHNDRCSRGEPIPSGDWLRRGRRPIRGAV